MFPEPVPVPTDDIFFQRPGKDRCLQAAINNVMGQETLKDEDLPDPSLPRPHPNFPDWKNQISGLVMDDVWKPLRAKNILVVRMDWKSRSLMRFHNNRTLKGKYIASGIHDGEGHAVGIDADRRLVFGWDVWSLDNPRCLHKVMNGGSISKWHKLENK